MTLPRLFGSLVLAVFVGLSSQQQDKLNYCRKWGHQTTVIDDKIYIDGGFVNRIPLEQNPTNYTNPDLVYADLNVNNEGFPQQFANLSKPSEVPVVNGGILWPDPVNKLFYLYGGEYDDEKPDSFSLWSYDTIYNTWNNTPVRDVGIMRASYGAGTTDKEQAIGYYYGGWLSSASVPGFGRKIPTSNLLIYDMIKDQWTNSSGPDKVPRVEGAMVHIPASDAGMLVHFGGLEFPDAPDNYTARGAPMEEIRLFDIANSKWYTQNATGDVPPMRNKFCAGAMWADDRSSYNIYVYGGASMPPNTIGFDDVYILSLPSFTWIKWYPEDDTIGSPHHSLSCNVVRNSQMIIMGGTFPNSTDCDVPRIQGQHNLHLDKKWGFFWRNLTSYNVPPEVSDKIGGGEKGGATKTAPENWADRDLQVYFSRSFTAAERTPTREIPVPKNGTSSDSGTNVGAIAGGTVGGAVFLIALLVLALILLRRIKRKRKAAAGSGNHPPGSDPKHPQFTPLPQNPIPELPNGNEYYDGYHKSTYPGSPASGHQRNISSELQGSPSIPPAYYDSRHDSSQMYTPGGSSAQLSPQSVAQRWSAQPQPQIDPSQQQYYYVGAIGAAELPTDGVRAAEMDAGSTMVVSDKSASATGGAPTMSPTVLQPQGGFVVPGEEPRGVDSGALPTVETSPVVLHQVVYPPPPEQSAVIVEQHDTPSPTRTPVNGSGEGPTTGTGVSPLR